MKTLQQMIKLLPLVLLLVVASCKKSKKEDPQPQPTATITTDELLNQYLVLTLTTSPRLRILYFSKAPDDFNGPGKISGTLDNLAGRRVQPVNVINNTFTYDTDGDGKKVYTFKLAKDDKGKISLTSATFQNQVDANTRLESSQLFKTADAPDFFGSKLKDIGEGNNVYIKFAADTWTLAQKPDFTGSITQGTFYKIAPGAWKGNLIGIECMGVSIPATANGPAMMGVDFAGNTAVSAYVPY